MSEITLTPEFEQWIAGKESVWNETYSDYHDLLQMAWNAGRNDLLDKLAAQAENDQEPSTVAAYYRSLKT